MRLRGGSRQVHDDTGGDCDGTESHARQTHVLCLRLVALAVGQVRRKRGLDVFSWSQRSWIRDAQFSRLRETAKDRCAGPVHPSTRDARVRREGNESRIHAGGYGVAYRAAHPSVALDPGDLRGS